MKRLFYLVITIFLASFLFGCQNNGSNSSDDSKTVKRSNVRSETSRTGLTQYYDFGWNDYFYDGISGWVESYYDSRSFNEVVKIMVSAFMNPKDLGAVYAPGYGVGDGITFEGGVEIKNCYDDESPVITNNSYLILRIWDEYAFQTGVGEIVIELDRAEIGFKDYDFVEVKFVSATHEVFMGGYVEGDYFVADMSFRNKTVYNERIKSRDEDDDVLFELDDNIYDLGEAKILVNGFLSCREGEGYYY